MNRKFGNWTSGNNHIDEFIKQTQLNAAIIKDIIEWIPFDKFANIKYLVKGGFGTVFKAVWTDGYIDGFDYEKDEWIRKPQMIVCLKSLDNSKDITRNFLEEVENQHKLLYGTAIEIYGITKNPNDHNYMMVMRYAKQGSLRKLLDSKYNDLKWDDKIDILYCIAKGLKKIHRASLMHKNFHSGNIVCEDKFDPYITDVGLCRPVSQNSISEEIYGVIPYIAPEVLYKKEYIQKSDIYSFGIIMSEVFTGYPPYHDISHDKDLAINVCLGYRPKIRCDVPQLLLDVMNKCLDDEPQNRPTAEKLANTLDQFRIDLKDEKSELYKQVKVITNSIKNSERLSYQTNKQAIYISQLLNFRELPEPQNTGGAGVDFEIIEFLNNTSLQWIPFNDLQIIEEIGKGGFATVYLARCKLNGLVQNVALKFLRESQNNFEVLLKELKVYYNIGCKMPTFLQCYGISKDVKAPNDYILVMQYAPKGSLKQNLRKVALLEWKEKLNLLSYVALDLKMMHSYDIVHRDLHSGNILQNSLYNGYIGDLGLAETVNQALAKSNGIYGVYPYIAPETLRKKEYTPASDIYSFGMIMWEVSSGRLVFLNEKHDLEFLIKVCSGVRPAVKGISQCYVDLMKRCWDNGPEKRPMASEIYEVIQSWKNDYKILSKFDDFDVIIDDESGAIHSQADYTSRFISHDELEIINSRTSGVTCINDNNNKIIESQEDNIPIEYMEKLMLKIDKVAE